MKKVFKITIIVVAVLAVILVTFGLYLGVFSSPQVQEKAMGPYTYIYEEHKGDYKELRSVFERVYKRSHKEGIKITGMAIGVYYNDPQQMRSENLRSDCGFVLQESELGRINEIEKKFKVGKIPMMKSIVVEFPLKNSFSYMVAPMKSYPKLNAYAEAKGLKMKKSYELYDEENKKIYTVMNIE